MVGVRFIVGKSPRRSFSRQLTPECARRSGPARLCAFQLASGGPRRARNSRAERVREVCHRGVDGSKEQVVGLPTKVRTPQRSSGTVRNWGLGAGMRGWIRPSLTGA